MQKRRLAVLVITLLGAAPLHAQGVSVSIGAGYFANDGVDYLISYQPAQSHWQVGYHYVSWSETFVDPYTGHNLTKTDYAMQGPLVNYLFSPEEERSWYVGMSVLKKSTTEKSLITGVSSSDATTDAYFGGGYTGVVSKIFYYNIGAYLSPTAETHTDTGVSSEDTGGGVDFLLQAGVVF